MVEKTEKWLKQPDKEMGKECCQLSDDEDMFSLSLNSYSIGGDKWLQTMDL